MKGCFFVQKYVNNLFGGAFMKITRYVNGKKVNKALSGEIVIQNDLISGTIEKINQRVVQKDSVRKNGIDG